MTGVEDRPEHQRGQRLPGIQTGVDESVDAAERAAPEAARRRATHQQVATGSGEADTESYAHHERPECSVRHVARREHRGHDSGKAERRRHDPIGTLLQKAGGQHSGAAADEIRGEPAARDND